MRWRRALVSSQASIIRPQLILRPQARMWLRQGTIAPERNASAVVQTELFAAHAYVQSTSRAWLRLGPGVHAHVWREAHYLGGTVHARVYPQRNRPEGATSSTDHALPYCHRPLTAGAVVIACAAPGASALGAEGGAVAMSLAHPNTAVDDLARVGPGSGTLAIMVPSAAEPQVTEGASMLSSLPDPPGVLYEALLAIHSTTGLGWAGAIALATVMMRLGMLPLSIYSDRNSRKFGAYVMPQVDKLHRDLTPVDGLGRSRRFESLSEFKQIYSVFFGAVRKLSLYPLLSI